ncbi:MAG: hypothetical protein AAF335_01185 [Bacteroidota bacterium]
MKPLFLLFTYFIGLSKTQFPTWKPNFDSPMHFSMNVSDAQASSYLPRREGQMFVNIDPRGDSNPNSLYEESMVVQPLPKEEDKKLREMIDVHYKRGIDYYNEKTYDPAIDEFQQALSLSNEISPNDFLKIGHAHFWLFSSFWAKEAFEEAKVHLSQIPSESIPKNYAGYRFHYIVTTTLLQANLYDEEIEKRMEGHAKYFFEIADKIEGKNIDKLGIYFKIGCAYNRLKTEEADRKATDYIFIKLFKSLKEFPRKWI